MRSKYNILGYCKVLHWGRLEESVKAKMFDGDKQSSLFPPDVLFFFDEKVINESTSGWHDPSLG